MSIDSVIRRCPEYPAQTREDFAGTVEATVEGFRRNSVFKAIEAGAVSIDHYHRYLSIIFHQTFESAATFALAGARCDMRHHVIRDYLIEHADEEKSHWQWVIDDLYSTGYNGADPRGTFPHPACQAYIAFNTYLALRAPIARLGTAAVLEGIGAKNGKRYGEALCRVLSLQPSQLKFVFGHGDTDVGHTADIIRVLSEADLTGHEWAWLSYAARTAGEIYKQMFEAILQ